MLLPHLAALSATGLGAFRGSPRMVFGVLWCASGVAVMEYTLGVRKTEEEVEVRLRRAVVKLSGTSGKALLA